MTARLLAWAVVYLFAVLLGGHLLDALVLVPQWSGEPPESIRTWVLHPQFPDVVPFFLPLVAALFVLPAASFAAGYRLGAQARRLRGIAVLCAVVHLALLLLFFVPTNQLLGFLPADAATQAPPEAVPGLVRQWVAWNWVRIAVDAVGLYAAARATAA